MRNPRVYSERKCYSCLVVKSLEEFYRSKHKPGGRMYKCKTCDKLQKTEDRKRRVSEEKTWEHDRQIKYPQRRKARLAVREAIKSMRLKKLPCEVCGKIEVHGHHEDYSKPLEVVWLCSQHHSDRHREIVKTSEV